MQCNFYPKGVSHHHQLTATRTEHVYDSFNALSRAANKRMTRGPGRPLAKEFTSRAELDSIPLERLQTPLEIETLFDEEGLRLAQEKQEAHAPHSSPNSSSDELSAVDSVTTSEENSM